MRLGDISNRGNDLIQQNEAELQDAFLNLKVVKGERTKAAVADDIDRIERTLADLEHQRLEVQLALEEQTISEETITDITQYAAELARNLTTIKNNFDSRRRFIEKLRITVTLKIEDGERVAYIAGRLGKKRLSVVSIMSRTLL